MSRRAYNDEPDKTQEQGGLQRGKESFQKATKREDRSVEKKWKAFWDPLSSSSDPRAVWHFLRKLFGEQRSECLCSVEEICEHFENVGKPQEDPDFCIENLREAEEWIFANASSNNTDDRNHSFPQDLRFSASEVKSGFEDLKNCALGLDGISKAIISPILIIIAPTIASLFTALLRFSVSPSDWQTAVLCLIKKKSSDRSNLNNFRAVHLLCFFYKWYTSCIRQRILPFVSASFPQQQRGFISEGSCAQAILAPLTVIQRETGSGGCVFACFVDIRKAFPWMTKVTFRTSTR